MLFEEIRQAVTNLPDALACLERFSKEASEEVQFELVEAIDAHSFRLVEWAESLLCLDEWLSQNSLSLATRDQVAYLRCTAELAEARVEFEPLKVLVLEMLSQYGCERAIPSSPKIRA